MCTRQETKAQEPTTADDEPRSTRLPWQTVGIDFFYHEGEEYRIFVDFYSFYFGIQGLKHTTAEAIVMFCQVVFDTHDLPRKLVRQNRPPFTSHKFAEYMSQFDIEHTTLNRHYLCSSEMGE